MDVLNFINAGSSSCELLSCRFPVGLACEVDIQGTSYRYQTENHLVMGVGAFSDDNEWDLDQAAIERLVTDPENRTTLAERASGVDRRAPKELLM